MIKGRRYSASLFSLDKILSLTALQQTISQMILTLSEYSVKKESENDPIHLIYTNEEFPWEKKTFADRMNRQ